MVKQILTPPRRIYAVGDVHGHLDKLQHLHGLIRRDLAERPAPAPLLVHLGDLIDRGPASAGCVGLLADGPPIPGVQTVNLMGNHEAMLLIALTRGRMGDARHWLENGGAACLRSWGVPEQLPPERWLEQIPAKHLVLLRDLALCHVQDGYVFVHAGVLPGVALAEQRPDDLLWIREGFLQWQGPMLPEAPDAVIVHGHTPRPEPVVRPNRIGVDTGAGHGGKLTCAVLEGGDVRFLQS